MSRAKGSSCSYLLTARVHEQFHTGRREWDLTTDILNDKDDGWLLRGPCHVDRAKLLHNNCTLPLLDVELGPGLAVASFRVRVGALTIGKSFASHLPHPWVANLTFTASFHRPSTYASSSHPRLSTVEFKPQ